MQNIYFEEQLLIGRTDYLVIIILNKIKQNK